MFNGWSGYYLMTIFSLLWLYFFGYTEETVMISVLEGLG
jgi:hypothetical protein